MLDIREFENISHEKIVSVQFSKNNIAPSFCGGWAKKLQTFTRHIF